MPKKIFKGKVVSTKMQKTVVVVVDMPKMHPIYKKTVKYTKRFKARDELGVKLGDTVIIEESKPFSKEVTWKVLEVVEATEGKK